MNSLRLKRKLSSRVSLPNLAKDLISCVDSEFLTLRNAKKSKSQEVYLRGQFKLYGIMAKPRRMAQDDGIKQWRKNLDNDTTEIEEDVHFLHEVLKTGMEHEYRDIHSFSLEYMLKQASVIINGLKLKPEAVQSNTCVQLEKVFRYGITTKSWWDTVDLFPRTMLLFRESYPDFVIPKLDEYSIDEHSIWLRRISIIHQLHAKGDTVNKEKLEEYILKNVDQQDFFVRKAIGWALRNYARQNATWVQDFVEAHEDQLSNLSKREALKHVGKKK